MSCAPGSLIWSAPRKSEVRPLRLLLLSHRLFSSHSTRGAATAQLIFLLCEASFASSRPSFVTRAVLEADRATAQLQCSALRTECESAVASEEQLCSLL